MLTNSIKLIKLQIVDFVTTESSYLIPPILTVLLDCFRTGLGLSCYPPLISWRCRTLCLASVLKQTNPFKHPDLSGYPFGGSKLRASREVCAGLHWHSVSGNLTLIASPGGLKGWICWLNPGAIAAPDEIKP